MEEEVASSLSALLVRRLPLPGGGGSFLEEELALMICFLDV